MQNHIEIPQEKIFDGRNVPCNVKHDQIFRRWLGLPESDYFVLVNDHDPARLREQFAVLFPENFGWEYIERGPEVFRVKISKVKEVAG